MAHRLPFRRQDSITGAEEVRPPSLSSDPKDASPDYDEKSGFPSDVKQVQSHLNPAEEDVEDLAAGNLLANGKERPIETAEDIATR